MNENVQIFSPAYLRAFRVRMREYKMPRNEHSINPQYKSNREIKSAQRYISSLLITFLRFSRKTKLFSGIWGRQATWTFSGLETDAYFDSDLPFGQRAWELFFELSWDVYTTTFKSRTVHTIEGKHLNCGTSPQGVFSLTDKNSRLPWYLLLLLLLLLFFLDVCLAIKRLHHRNWTISVVHAHDLTLKNQTFAWTSDQFLIVVP